MRTHFKTPARLVMWIAGIAVFLLAASVAAAIIRWVPPSYTSTSANRASLEDGAAPSGSRVARAQAAVAQTRTTSNRRNRASCAECGVIESMRQIGSSGDYEFTVRFRDGSNRIFNDTSPRDWPLGSRVIVIGGANSPQG